jgi:hypothetical protein
MLVPHAMFDDLVEDMNRTRDASNLFDPNRPNRRKLVGPAPATALAPGTLPCPQCGHLMGRHVFAGQELDRCATHGVWCDRDELAAVLERTAGVPEQWGFWRRFLDSLAGF